MPLLGAHTSTGGGLAKALYRAKEIGANITQIFTANQRRWRQSPLAEETVEEWHKARKELDIQLVVSHGGYLVNLCSDNQAVSDKSIKAFEEEISRCLALGIDYLNIHPGSSKERPVEEALDALVDAVSSVAHLFRDKKLTLLMESTAGEGTQLGWSLEHLQYLISRLENKVPIGVCIDTCHCFAAGYDLGRKDGWDDFIGKFDHLVGLKHLKLFHLNDSLNGCGERMDRHAALGDGKMGWAVFEASMSDPRTKDIPKILETRPHAKKRKRNSKEAEKEGHELWKKEIEYLKTVYDRCS